MVIAFTATSNHLLQQNLSHLHQKYGAHPISVENFSYAPRKFAGLSFLQDTSEMLNYSKKPATGEEQNAFLESFDFFVLVSKSIVADPAAHDNLRRIVNEIINLRHALMDVCVFGETTTWHKKVECPEQVDALFKKHKPTDKRNLAKALSETFEKHFRRVRNYPLQRSIILIITDKMPNEIESVTKVLEKNFAKLNKNQTFEYKDPTTGIVHKKTLELGLRIFEMGTNTEMEDYFKTHQVKLMEGAHPVKLGHIENLHHAEDVKKAFLDAIYG